MSCSSLNKKLSLKLTFEDENDDANQFSPMAFNSTTHPSSSLASVTKECKTTFRNLINQSILKENNIPLNQPNFDIDLEETTAEVVEEQEVKQSGNGCKNNFSSDDDENEFYLNNRKVPRNRKKKVINSAKNCNNSWSNKRKRSAEPGMDNDINIVGSNTPRKTLFNKDLDDFNSPINNKIICPEKVNSPIISEVPKAKRRSVESLFATKKSPTFSSQKQLFPEMNAQKITVQKYNNKEEDFENCNLLNFQFKKLPKNFSLDEAGQRRQELMEKEDSVHEQKFKKYHSLVESNIKSCLDNEDESENLIADFSAPYILPCIQGGKHSDLKAISHHTLTDVIQGKYDELIENYVIIDCRYPYEYDGGHIVGAKNIFQKDSILSEFITKPNNNIVENNNVIGRKNILIFHCEFSSERGPKMYRFLRNKDRELNQDNYPHLLYPEIYLLENGYKEFYLNHLDFCYPASYKPMLHQDHGKDLVMYRTSSKLYRDKYEKRSKTRTRSRLSSKFESFQIGENCSGKISEDDDTMA